MDVSEKQSLLNRMEASRARLLEVTAGLTAEQWTFHPAEGCWSIAECLEHIIIVERRVVAGVQKWLTQPAQPEKKAEAAAKDARLGGLAERVNRVQAPAAVVPTGAVPAERLLEEFESTRARTIEFINGTEADLRSHFAPHPVLQDLDCYQWLIMVSVHCDRHVRQIEEIKAAGSTDSANL